MSQAIAISQITLYTQHPKAGHKEYKLDLVRSHWSEELGKLFEIIWFEQSGALFLKRLKTLVFKKELDPQTLNPNTLNPQP